MGQLLSICDGSRGVWITGLQLPVVSWLLKNAIHKSRMRAWSKSDPALAVLAEPHSGALTRLRLRCLLIQVKGNPYQDALHWYLLLWCHLICWCSLLGQPRGLWFCERMCEYCFATPGYNSHVTLQIFLRDVWCLNYDHLQEEGRKERQGTPHKTSLAR